MPFWAQKFLGQPSQSGPMSAPPSMEEASRAKKKARKSAKATAAVYQAEGWVVLDPSKQKLVLQENVELTHPALLLNFTASHSLLDIFESFFTPQLVTDLLEKTMQERLNLFFKKSGENTVQKLHV